MGRADRVKAKAAAGEVTEATQPEPAPVGPPTVAIGGVDYPLGTLRYSEVVGLAVLAKAARPSALEAIGPQLGSLNATQQRYAIESAVILEREPVLPGSPEFLEYVYSPAGLAECLALSLRRGGSDVPRAESDAAADAMPFAEGMRVVGAALGRARG